MNIVYLRKEAMREELNIRFEGNKILLAELKKKGGLNGKRT